MWLWWKIIQRNDWLEEENANIAQEGLLTLVMGWETRRTMILQIRIIGELEGRNKEMSAVTAQFLEHDLELLGLTGVEDRG